MIYVQKENVNVRLHIFRQYSIFSLCFNSFQVLFFQSCWCCCSLQSRLWGAEYLCFPQELRRLSFMFVFLSSQFRIYIHYIGRQVYHIYAFPSFPFTVRAVALARLYQSLKKKLHLLLVVVARWLGRLNSRLIQKQWQQSSIVELQVLALGIVLIAVIVASIVQWCGVVEQELSKQPFGGNICDMSSSLCSFSSAEMLYFILEISVANVPFLSQGEMLQN